MTAEQSDLFTKFLEGEISDHEALLLLDAVKNDPELATAFSNELILHRELQFALDPAEQNKSDAAQNILYYLQANAEGEKEEFIADLREKAESRATSSKRTVSTKRSITTQRKSKSNREIKSRKNYTGKTKKRGFSWSSMIAPMSIAASIVFVFYFILNPKSKPQPKSAPNLFAKITEMDGESRVATGNTSSAASVGQYVKPGNKLITSDSGHLILRYPDGTMVNIEPESRVIIEKGKSGNQIVLTLKKGSIGADVKKQPPSTPMLVYSDKAVITVLGTQFRLVADKEKSSLTVTEGRVSFTRRQDRKSVIVTNDQQIASTDMILRRNYYISQKGSDADMGSIESPFKTLEKAMSILTPGDNVSIRGGEYSINHNVNINGTEETPITFEAYNNEKVVFKGNYIPGDMNFNPNVHNSFYVTGNWLVFRNLKFENATNGMYVKSNASHNRFENLILCNNYNSGLVMSEGASYNTIINCDAYRQYASLTKGKHSNGFTLNNNIGPGNRIIGCRSWGNGDDGFALWATENSITLINCLSFENGKDNWNIGNSFKGTGDGFNLGKQESQYKGHLVLNCKAWKNAKSGFNYDHSQATMTLFRNISWKNGTDAFRFGLTKHRLIQNSAIKPFTNSISKNVQEEDNSWNKNYNINADIISFDDTLIKSSRTDNGSIRNNGFLELKKNSQFYDPAVSAKYSEWIDLINKTF